MEGKEVDGGVWRMMRVGKEEVQVTEKGRRSKRKVAAMVESEESDDDDDEEEAVKFEG